MPGTDFQTHDRVRHAGKPDWGVGIVLSVQRATHEGRPCQRLTVRFDQAGKKTISTAFADLRPLDLRPAPTRPAPRKRRPASPAPAPVPSPPPEAPGSPEEIRTLLVALPNRLSDPFRPLSDRLTDTLDMYQFEQESRTLLDWASIQTGLRDTLSILSRHELEHAFGVFRIALDRHLKVLLVESRRAGLDVSDLIAPAPSAAHQALRRINHPR
ncbi:MAG: DUF3553 domain-containing protein [Phycisphaerales bacterium]|nr:DUF3553 domain-containing protein [Phycisphaerales bacterium]